MNKINFYFINKGLALISGLFLVLAFSGVATASSMKTISDHQLGDRSIKSQRATTERTAPVGKVCLEGEECSRDGVNQAKVDAGNSSASEAAPKEPRDAAQIVQSACFGCHGTGAAGAPVIGKPIWKELESQKGIDGLVSNAITGKGAMPPKGMCMDCSDEEIKAAVEYIVAQ